MSTSVNSIKNIKNKWGFIVAGVGGQGAVTVAQLFLGAAWKSNLYTLQSEVHGMSQRGGSVSAQILFDKQPVTSPLIVDGEGDFLVGMEPLEALRYIHLIKNGAPVFVSTTPIKNMGTYPDVELLINELKKYKNVFMINSDEVEKTLGNKHAGGLVLVGMASTILPIERSIWANTIRERFLDKGERVVEKNLEAFEYGRNLMVSKS